MLHYKLVPICTQTLVNQEGLFVNVKLLLHSSVQNPHKIKTNGLLLWHFFSTTVPDLDLEISTLTLGGI